jgi:CDP-diacylglycerol--glycerol-3-phosphate 3-phosphatidyltransferase
MLMAQGETAAVGRKREGVFAHWPNRITALRFVGSAALFVLLSLPEMQSRPAQGSRLIAAAFWLFVIVASTDVLDGWLARRGGTITVFGRIADPLVDKVLVLGAMVFLALLDWSKEWFPAWIVVVVLAREFLVTSIRGWAESQGLAFPADGFGKVKMIVQCVAISVVLGNLAFRWPEALQRFWSGAAHALVWATLVATVGSGVSYVLKTRRLLLGD